MRAIKTVLGWTNVGVNFLENGHIVFFLTSHIPSTTIDTVVFDNKSYGIIISSSEIIVISEKGEQQSYRYNKQYKIDDVLIKWIKGFIG